MTNNEVKKLMMIMRERKKSGYVDTDSILTYEQLLDRIIEQYHEINYLKEELVNAKKEVKHYEYMYREFRRLLETKGF